MADARMEKESRKNGLIDRLELIKKRHRALILEPRETVASEIDADYEEEFDEMFDEDVQIEELVEVEAE
jgi:hypothetical protein